MAFPANDITQLIPQKYPFVMVGKLLFADETTTRSSFVIHADNVFVKNGIFQEAGLMENIAQTAALRAGYKASVEKAAIENGYIGSINNFEVFELPEINNELITEVIKQDEVFNVTIVAGKVWLNNKLIASCEMKVFTGN
jgi:3-hydroxymyristoyl/3-hydroxydecanoyl-(acyl carrier protein) dehydratase